MSPAECPISLTRDCQDRALLGMGLLHAAYNGSPQHRREIKKEPCMQADYLTVPLSSRRAAGVLGHDYKRMGLRSEQVDHETYADCAVPSLQRFHLVRAPLFGHAALPAWQIPLNNARSCW